MQKKILVVDDNRDLADGLAMILEDEGYAVVQAYDGSSAIELLDTGTIGAAFIDIKLPDISGLEIFSRTKAMQEAMPVVLMTGYRIEQVLETACAGRPVTVLRYPFAMDKLLRTLSDRPGGIVLVDNDEAGFATELRDAVIKAGSRCVLVSDEKNIKDAAGDQVDVMLLDLENTVISGLVSFLCCKDQWPHGSFVMIMGARQQRDNVIDPLSSPNITGCLYKPFRPESLVALLEAMPL